MAHPITALFHVVCRDCAFESLVTTSADAETVSETHRTETEHRTTYARVE